jgi:hypothetical protein
LIGAVGIASVSIVYSVGQISTIWTCHLASALHLRGPSRPMTGNESKQFSWTRAAFRTPTGKL